MTKQRGYYNLVIGGEERTMHFSMNFWINFTDALDVSIDEVGNIFQNGIKLSVLRTLLYSALLAHDQEQGIKPSYSEFTVGEWLSDLEATEVEKIITAMTESRILGNDLNVGIERNPTETETPKKKQ